MAIVKRVAAVVVSIVWLSLILVLLAAFLAPGIQERLPTGAREFIDPDALRQRLDILADSLPAGIGDPVSEEPQSVETPTSEPALSTTLTPTPAPETPTAAPPAAESAMASPEPTSGAMEERAPPAVEQPASISVTVATQAELRSGPSADADVIGLVAEGGAVTVTGQDPDGRWYRLENDTWIAAESVADAPQGQIPVVMSETQQAIADPGAQPSPSETPVATPTAQRVAVRAVINADANLRSSPDVESERVGGAHFGEEVLIVGKSADGAWYRLENGAWLFADLVVEAVDVPVVAEDSVPASPSTAETDAEQTDTDTEQTETERTETDTEQTETDTEQTDTDTEQTETDTEQTETERTETDTEQTETDTEQTDTETERTETDTEQTETDTERTDTDTERTDTDTERTDTDTEQTDTDTERPQPVVIPRRGANLRAGPGVQFDRVAGVAQGQILTVVAQDPGGEWLKLKDGSWIFATLVANAPADLPVESDAQTDEDKQPVLATVNTEAHLRNRPSLVDTTIVALIPAGAQVSILEKSDDGQWFQLDSGYGIDGQRVQLDKGNDYWISAELVDIVPDGADEDADAGDEEDRADAEGG